MSAKIKANRNTIIAYMLLTISFCAMLISGYQLWNIQREDHESHERYEQLVNKVRPDGFVYVPPEVLSGYLNDVEILEMSIDFMALKEISKNAVAWLYSPNTVIDYPVMRTYDYDQYLRHLPDGTYNTNGSLFIDYNNMPDFSDSLTVIYGHNMKTGWMFGSLEGYKSQTYFEKHPYMYLYTASDNFRIDLIYGFVIEASEWREKAFMYKENLHDLLSYAAYNTTFTSEVRYTGNERVVALSTCSYEFKGARYVVIGVLRSC